MHEILLDAPGKNAISTAVLEGLEQQLEQAAGEPVLLTGAGDAFSAGLNLVEVAGFDPSGLDGFLSLLDRVCAKLFDYPGVTVAWVNGHAIAGGSVLALCCDHRVGTENPKVKLGLNETALGVTFPPLIQRICEHRLGPRLAPEVMLGAGLFGPEKAIELGILHRLGTREDAEAEVARRAGHPAGAYAATKAILQRGVTGMSDGDLAKARADSMTLWTGDDFRARIEAALGR
ncbi:MAG: enoyl-CoA hydratase/isomerase family protein [Deltaproteobacteria bacterium]|nr:enoyl-CoA hydratase/isomerase family protein [Deltaproteobacteria bacterium]